MEDEELLKNQSHAKPQRKEIECGTLQNIATPTLPHSLFFASLAPLREFSFGEE